MSTVAEPQDTHTRLAPKGRIVFLIRLKPRSVDRFLAAYEDVRHQVAENVPGHLMDQVCQSPTDPDNWMITSEWDSLDRFLDWEASTEHRTLIKPMRECIDRAHSLRFVVREETAPK
ncbi:antibiotic biosynthesis monooxygenase [Streptomyces triticagri]|uniref:Antibiotic biosynthesis monooxygenase n=1 Tax=Streptomyces triticagri TaxID=2293568 RepID=A0A372LVV2_9ACTN|nr:antibiotic biosynthesis monooxygenase family protein [Streptomyces triticagri]RFU82784.1 antibiotic biosynthesis monooxygenase [Streptomyces triticagri]